MYDYRECAYIEKSIVYNIYTAILSDCSAAQDGGRDTPGWLLLGLTLLGR